MCVKSDELKKLNPKAQEWRSTTPPLQLSHQYQLPCLIYNPQFQTPMSPQTTGQVVAFAAAPLRCNTVYAGQTLHQQMAAYCYSPFQYYWAASSGILAQPVYHHAPPPESVIFPENGCIYEAPALVSDGNEVEVLRNPRDHEKTKSPVVKSPKSPLLGSRVKYFNGGKRCFPPRMQGLYRSFSVDEKPNPMKIWRPMKINSDDGGAVPVPPISPADPLPGGADIPNLSGNTTVMIKNIPNQLRRDFMLEYLDQYCRDYSLEYDFLYLPMDFRNGQNLGYAFVNFTNSGAAHKFKSIVEGSKWVSVIHPDRRLSTSKKVIHITWARVQGIESLLVRFQRSNFHCYDSDYLPVHLDPPRNGLDTNPPLPLIIGKVLRVDPY